MSKYALSIIIPTDRYSPYLAKILRYLKYVCNYYDIEIIIISTTDNPANRLYEKICKNFSSCIYYTIEREKRKDTRARQMNLGVFLSHSDYVYIIGDDLLPTCKLLRNLLEVLRYRGVDAILHAMIPRPISLWSKIRMIEKIFSSFNIQKSSCRIIRRDIFIKLGGYRDDLVLGEDIDFQNRLVAIKPNIIAILPDKGFEIHLGEYKTLSAYIRRAYYYGKHMKTLAQYIGVRRMLHAYVATPIAIRDMPKYFRLYILALILYEVVIALATIVGRLFGKKYE